MMVLLSSTNMKGMCGSDPEGRRPAEECCRSLRKDVAAAGGILQMFPGETQSWTWCFYFPVKKSGLTRCQPGSSMMWDSNLGQSKFQICRGTTPPAVTTIPPRARPSSSSRCAEHPMHAFPKFTILCFSHTAASEASIPTLEWKEGECCGRLWALLGMLRSLLRLVVFSGACLDLFHAFLLASPLGYAKEPSTPSFLWYSFSKFSLHLIILGICDSQRTTLQESGLYFYYVGSGIKLRSQDLVGSTTKHCAATPTVPLP